MLGPDDVGHRVVVRRVVDHRGGRPMMSDALGVLREATDERLVVDTARGPVAVARTAVVAAKRVPPRPVTRHTIAALERAASEAWPAVECEQLGQWQLRAAGGWSLRANSALPVGDPGLPLPAAIARVHQWYADRGLPPRVNVPLPLAAPVDAALAAAGWAAGRTVLVQTCVLADLSARLRPDGSDGGEAVTLTDAPTSQWLALTGRHGPGAAADTAVALEVLTGAGRLPVRFGHVYDPAGRLVAAGRGTVTGEGRWLGLSRMAVDPSARRRGLARSLVAALAGWAARTGATDVFLQVEDDNEAALALYARLGFTTHHRYVPRRG